MNVPPTPGTVMENQGILSLDHEYREPRSYKKEIEPTMRTMLNFFEFPFQISLSHLSKIKNPQAEANNSGTPPKNTRRH